MSPQRGSKGKPALSLTNSLAPFRACTRPQDHADFFWYERAVGQEVCNVCNWPIIYQGGPGDLLNYPSYLLTSLQESLRDQGYQVPTPAPTSTLFLTAVQEEERTRRHNARVDRDAAREAAEREEAEGVVPLCEEDRQAALEAQLAERWIDET